VAFSEKKWSIQTKICSNQIFLPITAHTISPHKLGTNPLSFIETYLAWVDSNLVISIVSHRLDPKELILLLLLAKHSSEKESY
jgi:hypothetical protein